MPIVPNVQYSINVYSTNAASDMGTVYKLLVKVYVGAPDDLATQKALVKKFDKEWRERKMTLHSSPVTPGEQGIHTFKTDPLSVDEANDINSGRKTLYYIIRFAFQDATGKWESDYCYDNQSPTKDYSWIRHPCDGKYNRHRYPAKPH